MQLLALPLLLLGQFQAPLDDAIAVYRSQEPILGCIPNEGTRSEPLVLDGPELIVEPDGTAYFHFAKADKDSAITLIPASAHNGSITLSILYRESPTNRWTVRSLFAILDPPLPGTVDPRKRCMIYVDGEDKYYARFHTTISGVWANAQSTTLANASQFHTVSAVWDADLKQNRLYVNGQLEATANATNPRQDALEDGIFAPHVANPDTYNTSAAGDFASWAIHDRAFDDLDAYALYVNDDWYEGGGEGTPPPPPGVIVVKVDGVTQPAGTTVKIDGVEVPPPSDPEDIIIEVETPQPMGFRVPLPTHDKESVNCKRWLAQASHSKEAWQQALAYRITGDEAYRVRALALADETVAAKISFPFGGETKTIDSVAGNQYLDAGRQYRNVFCALDWCGPSLAQRQAWLAWGQRHLGKTDGSEGGSFDKIWWQNRWSRDNPANNYFHSFCEATSYYALASGDTTWLAFLKADRFQLVRDYYGTTPEGGSREGTAYGESHRSLFELAKLWRDADGTEILPQEFIDGSLLYWTHATAPGHGWVALIGDQTRTHGRTDGYHRHIIGAALSLATANKSVGHWQLSKLAPINSPFFYPLELVDFPSGEPPESLTYHAKGAGHYFTRTSWEADATYLVCVAGRYDEAHAQQDQGSFAVFAAGRWQTCSDSPWTHGGIEQGTNFQNVVRFGVPQKQGTAGTLSLADGGIDMDLTAPAQRPWRRRIYWTGKSPLIVRDWCDPAAEWGFCKPSEDDFSEPYVSNATATVGKLPDGFLSMIEW